MVTIYVYGLEFYGYHGVSDEEQAVGHRYQLNVELGVHTNSTSSDRVTDTVDYSNLGLRLITIAMSKKYRLMEKLAQVLAEAVLDEYPLVETVSINLCKRLPPAPLIAEAAGVQLQLNRKNAR